MTTFLLLKIVHGIGILLLLLMLTLSSLRLFRMQDEQLAGQTPRFVIALQHSTFTLLLLTGGTIKAFRRKEGILLAQRRAGIVIAWIALVAILVLVKLKPVFS
jgi:hypothetical protein